MTQPPRLFIQGVTRDGKPFRPSDWAERLAGAMACFRPEGGPRGRFVTHFARDNDLVVVDPMTQEGA